jgi:spermidine dehydrogenase
MGVLAGSAVIGSIISGEVGAPAMAEATSQGPTIAYPPLLQGLRGQNNAALAVPHALRDGATFDDGEETGEVYDLIVVGAGMSGLSSAYFFKKALPNSKVLILDNCDDFGGHARRNEFNIEGRQLLGVGGAFQLMFPNTYTPEGKALLSDIGISTERLANAMKADGDALSATQFNTAVFFDKETYGVDRLVSGFPDFESLQGSSPDQTAAWTKFLSQAPLSDGAKAGLLKIANTNRDFFPGLTATEKISRLRKISYADYLVKILGVHPDTIVFMQNLVGGSRMNIGAGPDSFSAWRAYHIGYPGFYGMGLPPSRLCGFLDDKDVGEDVNLPDGNGGVARLLVRWLIPKALPGHSMEDSVVAHVNYSLLDDPGSDVRIRLNSTVVRAHHVGDPSVADAVEVTYVRGGKSFKVRSSTCVMACFNAIVPYLCPELPQSQKDALHLAVRKPIIWASVALRNWRAFHNLKLTGVAMPGCFFTRCILDPGFSIGDYAGSSGPDQPAMLYLVMSPSFPGLTARDQYRAGRKMLLGIDIDTYDSDIRRVLDRALAGGGFDAKRDIAGITINRWGHSYACGANDLFDPEWSNEEVPWVVGRKRLGRIAIANSDASGISMTQAAFDQGNRAVRELLTEVIRPQFWEENRERG